MSRLDEEREPAREPESSCRRCDGSGRVIVSVPWDVTAPGFLPDAVREDPCPECCEELVR